jgi:hypothetical protein
MPVPPDLQAAIDELGIIRTHGEFVFFQYHACGHKNWFPRDSSTWSLVPIMRAVLAYHRSCPECAHPYPEVEPPPDPPRRPRAVPAALSGHRVVIEGIFPDLLRCRLPAWSDDVVLYIERKRLPPEIDAHLLEPGYRFAVDADLDALTPEALIASFRNWYAGAFPQPECQD